MSMRNRIGRTCFHTIPAKDTSIVVNVINLGVALRPRNAVLCGVLVRLDVNTVRRTCRGTQKTGYAFLQPVLVALQHVLAAKALLKLRTLQRTRAIRIILHDGGLEHLFQGDTHSLSDRANVLDDGHVPSSIADGVAAA